MGGTWRGWMVAVVVFGGWTSGPLLGQATEQPGSPEAVTRAFYGSFQAARWEAMAETLDPRALDLFRFRVMSVIDGDATGGIANRVFGASPASVRALSDPDLFAGLTAGIYEFAAGMMQAMMSKEVKILGHVLEEDSRLRENGDQGTLAQVVVRSREPLSGSAPSTVSVVTLARVDGGWRVLWSQELDVIASALVAVPGGGHLH